MLRPPLIQNITANVNNDSGYISLGKTFLRSTSQWCSMLNAKNVPKNESSAKSAPTLALGRAWVTLVDLGRKENEVDRIGYEIVEGSMVDRFTPSVSNR